MMFNAKSWSKSNATHADRRSMWPNFVKGGASRVIGAICLVLLAGSSAFGNLAIQPLQIQIAARPNKQFSQPITLENMDNESVEGVDLQIVDITQDPNGLWRLVKHDDPPVERSCASWLRLPADTLTLEPNQRKVLLLEGRAESGLRGHYSAGILATTRPRLSAIDGVEANMSFQYLIPIIFEVQGRTVRDEVSLVDAGLKFLPQTMTREPASLITMTVQNSGSTYASLNAMGLVWAKQGGHWRKVSEVAFSGRSILPGVTFTHHQDVGRPLASGTYKVQVFLYVNGRRTDYHEAMVEFEGDSRLDIVDQKGNAVLILDPPVVDIEAIPGAMRTARMTVSNFSEEAVDVEVEVAMPEILMSKTGELADGTPVFGERLSCQPWLKVEPQKFTVRGYGRQNIRIIADMPEAAGNHPHYYGVLRLHTSYPDNQVAGTSEGYAFVTTRGVQESPVLEGMQLGVSDLSSTRYLVTARYVNKGDTHIMPISCSGMLLLDSNSSFRRRFVMSPMDTLMSRGRMAYMLPMSSRMFTGTVDITDIEPGDYRLVSQLSYDKAPRPVIKQQGIRIIEENGTKRVEVIGLDAIGGESMNIPLL